MSVCLREGIDALVSRAAPFDGLVGHDFLQDLRRRSLDLPSIVEAFGFEVGLSGVGGVDLGIALSCAGGGRKTLARAGRSLGSPGRLLDSPHWRRVCEFAARWESPGSVEFNAVTHAFLEFDTSGGMQAIGAPSIFAGMSVESQYAHRDKKAVETPALGVRRSGSAALSVVANLLGTSVREDLHTTLDRCTTRLPLGSLILHVGVMLSRANAVRLHVCVPEDSAAGYLAACGAPDAAEAVPALLARYGAGDPLATIQLEMGANVGSGIGIEFSPPSAVGREGTSGVAGWRTLLDRLSEDGLCKESQGEMLRAWPGVFHVPPTAGSSIRTIRQDLSHVKVTLRPDRPPQAKAYLSVVPSFQLFAPK